MNIVTQLERVLEEEQRLLLAGDYVQLDKLADIKMKLSERLSHSPPKIPAQQAQKLAQTVRHNEALLDSAQRGIQAAMTHLREAREGSFQSYTKEGQRTPMSTSSTVRQRI